VSGWWGKTEGAGAAEDLFHPQKIIKSTEEGMFFQHHCRKGAMGEYFGIFFSLTQRYVVRTCGKSKRKQIYSTYPEESINLLNVQKHKSIAEA
jgi:hypothetical protein